MFLSKETCSLVVFFILIIIPKDSPIKTAADLKGKNIGVDQMGGTPMSVATMVLGNEGINPKTGVIWKSYPLDQLKVCY